MKLHMTTFTSCSSFGGKKTKWLIGDMLQPGIVIIHPPSSPWASLVLLVLKRDGSIRFCIYHNWVNAIRRKGAYSLPHMDDTSDTLIGSQWFTTLNLDWPAME